MGIWSKATAANKSLDESVSPIRLKLLKYARRKSITRPGTNIYLPGMIGGAAELHLGPSSVPVVKAATFWFCGQTHPR